MQNYVFMTDSDSDLPLELKQQYDIPVVYMPYSLDGKEYFDDLGQSLNHKSFYDKMRAGSQPTTSALNETVYMEYFEPILSSGRDLLFAAFSSQLSATIQAIYAAREELLKQYPERKFIVVDTLSISAPQTILVLKAHEMYRAGKPMEEVAQWLEDNKLRAQAWFTVDDLKYLQRGGRISATAAALGTLLDLKPILTETLEGKLAAAGKVRGRRKAMSYILEKAVENVADQKEAMGIILHADAMDDAQKLRQMLVEKLPEMDIRIYPVGPVIGTHAGPGTIAFCFLGKKREIGFIRRLFHANRRQSLYLKEKFRSAPALRKQMRMRSFSAKSTVLPNLGEGIAFSPYLCYNKNVTFYFAERSGGILWISLLVVRYPASRHSRYAGVFERKECLIFHDA